MTMPALPRLVSRVILLAVLLHVSGFAYAENAAESALDLQLNEQILSVPGDADRPVMLQVTIFKPNGPGPFPLAVLNHGKEKGNSHDEPRYRSAYAARYFVSRGYAVVLPMLRGFAGSGGEFQMMGCDAEGEGIAQAQDIRAVIRFMVTLPDIDSSQILVFGQSYGGWNSLAVGTLNIPGVKGVVNFAGGRSAPFCANWPHDLAVGAGYYGRKSHVPSIWFYGDNDSKFSVNTWRGMYENYVSAGGKAELVAYGAFEKDSHNFLGAVEALPIWVPKLDAFLEQVGLPNKILRPELLPQKYPGATAFADVSDLNAVPFLSENGRSSYKEFLTKEMPRVFVISPDGFAVSEVGGYDPLAKAMDVCAKYQHECRAYAVDNSVVWPLPALSPLPTHFAAIDDVNAIPLVNEKGRETYQQFLKQPMPRVFVIAPDGVSAATHGGFDPLDRALQLCKKYGRTCTPYAINDQVVWPVNSEAISVRKAVSTP